MNIDDYDQATIDQVLHEFDVCSTYISIYGKISVKKIRNDWGDLYIRIQEISLI